MITVKVGRDNWEIAEIEDALAACQAGPTATKRVVDKLVRCTARPLRAGEDVLRVTWSKATRAYPSKPTAELVTVAYADDRPTVDLTDGRRVLRQTLYTLYLATAI